MDTGKQTFICLQDNTNYFLHTYLCVGATRSVPRFGGTIALEVNLLLFVRTIQQSTSIVRVNVLARHLCTLDQTLENNVAQNGVIRNVCSNYLIYFFNCINFVFWWKNNQDMGMWGGISFETRWNILRMQHTIFRMSTSCFILKSKDKTYPAARFLISLSNSPRNQTGLVTSSSIVYG